MMSHSGGDLGRRKTPWRPFNDGMSLAPIPPDSVQGGVGGVGGTVAQGAHHPPCRYHMGKWPVPVNLESIDN